MPARNTITKININNKYKKFNFRRALKLMLIFIPIGFIIYFVHASSPTEAPIGSSSACGARVSTYNFQRLYDKSTPWNVPVCANGMPKLPQAQSDDYRDRLWNYSIAPIANNNAERQETAVNRGRFMTMFGLDTNGDYSTPVYKASDATTTIQVQVCGQAFCVPSNIDSDDYNIKIGQGKGYLPDTTIPWNPAWKPSAANDKEMTILDDRTTPAKEYGFWGLQLNQFNAISNCGILFRERLCAWGASVIRDYKGNIADYKGSTTVRGGRGMGIQGAPMVITPEEVEQGEIRQALYMEAFNTMVGPACTTDQLRTNDLNVVGKTCGFAFAPSTQFEFASATNISRNQPGQTPGCPATTTQTDYFTGKTLVDAIKIPQMIPSGTRFAIKNTDAEIDAWLATKTTYSPAKKKTAKIIATALRDYGWFVGDTTCFGAGFVFSGTANTTTAAKWKTLGIDDASSQLLLQGLFQKDKIYTVGPSVNQCVDGSKSNYACSTITSSYPDAGSSTATTSTATTVSPISTPAPINPIPNTTTPTGTTATTTPATTTNITPPVVAISLQPDWSRFTYYLQVNLTPPVGITKPIAYNVLRNDVAIGKTSGTSFLDYNLHDGIRYNYKVQALDLNGKVTTTSTNTAGGTKSCFMIWCSLK